ncbi:MAG: DNA-methyltransferase, partial [Dolichospermum sp.]
TVESVKRYISKLQQWISTGKQPIQNVSHKKQYLFNETKLNFNYLYREDGNFDANFTNVWSFAPTMHQPGRRTTGVYLHPNEKPLEIMKRLVEMLTDEGGTVLDPFAGSGTTAVACKELGRNYICIEKELEYYQIACNRINQPVEQGTDEPIETVAETSPMQLNLF